MPRTRAAFCFSAHAFETAQVRRQSVQAKFKPDVDALLPQAAA